MATLSDAMLLCNIPIHECYHLYLDACTKLKPFRYFITKVSNRIILMLTIIDIVMKLVMKSLKDM